MSTFCQRSYHRKCQSRVLGGLQKPKCCQHSLWTTPWVKIHLAKVNILFWTILMIWRPNNNYNTKFTWNFVKIGRTIKLEFWIVPKTNWHGRKRFCTDKFSRLIHWNGTVQISIPTFNGTTQMTGLDFTSGKNNIFIYI